MAIEFHCPQCERKLRTGDDKSGKIAKCPGCGEPVTVPAAGEGTGDDFGGFAAFDAAATLAPLSASRSASAVAQVACPMCGGRNDRSASRCFACGEDLSRAEGAEAPSLHFSNVWGTGWELWTANLGLCVASLLMAGVAVFFGYGLFLVVPAFVGFMFFGAMGGQNEAAGLFVLFGLLGLGYMALLAFMVYLQLGLSNFALAIARTRIADLGKMFPPVSKLPAAFVCMFVVYLVAGIASVPGIAAQFGAFALAGDNAVLGMLLTFAGYGLQWGGAFLAGAFFWPVPYLIADRTSSLFAALGDGPKMALANPKLSLLLALVNIGLLLAGWTACFIGLLFSYSLSFVLFAVAYDRCEKAARISA